MQMRQTLPGCPGEDQAIAERLAEEEAALDKLVSVNISLTIRMAEVRETVSMTRRRFEELKAEIDTDIGGLIDRIDCGDIDFDDWSVDIDKFQINS